jgi:hypothetical protein
VVRLVLREASAAGELLRSARRVIEAQLDQVGAAWTA